MTQLLRCASRSAASLAAFSSSSWARFSSATRSFSNFRALLTPKCACRLSAKLKINLHQMVTPAIAVHSSLGRVALTTPKMTLRVTVAAMRLLAKVNGANLAGFGGGCHSFKATLEKSRLTAIRHACRYQTNVTGNKAKNNTHVIIKST
jgi:hypothetical protein